MRNPFLCLGFMMLAAGPLAGEPGLKQHSAFYRPERLAQIRENLERHPDGERLRKQALQNASYWRSLSDDQLWGLVFGPSISRSWMVWSNGRCPACTNAVTMYNWQIDAQKHPWKVQCPHCREFFPKNDFAAFYRSGLDARGWFDPTRADRSLLLNLEHSDPDDPLRGFGVDDGEGYVQGNERWRFIGAYLVYGQFKQLIRDGVQALAVAWVLTGDTNCARKAGILLDRVADIYPEFDYARQGLVYERRDPSGYVSVWHDACEETRELVLAYDQVFEGICHDSELVRFLAEKAREFGLANPKTNFAGVQRNIEDRLLRDALNSPAKMHSNFPRREIAYTIIKTVLEWPRNRAEVEDYMAGFIKQATAVDGVTGEKGLAGYSAYTITGLAGLLAEFARADTNFLPRLIARVPSLRQTWRFHIDTFCLDAFYPLSGDTGTFAQPVGHYAGAAFAQLTQPRLEPSMFTFFWQLYQATGDPVYVQALYRENGDTLEGLPHDLCAADPERIRRDTAGLIRKHGPRPNLGSLMKTNWHIGILRSGEGANARALWLDWDAGGAHGHLDAMTLGLFARGRDCLPEFGYPPVQHGGWSTPQVAWYLSPPAHNTVVIDGRRPSTGAGTCTLWADGTHFHMVRAEAGNLVGASRFERSAMLIDVSPADFYVVDLFRVIGGGDHAKYVHGPNAALIPHGLKLEAADPYGHGALMRNFRRDPQPSPGWSAEWKLAGETSSRSAMRYTDFSQDAEAFTAEANVMPYRHPDPNGFWNPALVIRRRGTAPLNSVFVSTLKVFDGPGAISGSRRLEVRHAGLPCTNGCVALELNLQNKHTDFLLACAPEDAGRATDLEPSRLRFTGEFAWVRRTADQRIARAAFCRAASLKWGALTIECDNKADIIELEFANGGLVRTLPPTNTFKITAGPPEAVRIFKPEQSN